MSDVLGAHVGHSVSNVGHVRMSDDFSYTLGGGYDCWILHKKLVQNRISTIFHKCTHISLNIGTGTILSNPQTQEYTLPFTGHMYYIKTPNHACSEGMKSDY